MEKKFIITEEDANNIKKYLRERSTYKIMSLLNRLEEIKENNPKDGLKHIEKINKATKKLKSLR